MRALLKKTGGWWLIPIVVVGAVLIVALVGLSMTELVAPFLYEVF